MAEKEYSVSEAVRLIGVESHVLRYWEEELSVEIRRSAQGHRVYSEENIDTFRRVRELKEKGLQLKAIRLLLDERGCLTSGLPPTDAGFAEQIRGLAGEDGCAKRAGGRNPDSGYAEQTGETAGSGAYAARTDDAREILRAEIVPVDEPEPMRRFEQLLRRLIEEVVSEQNEKLEETIAARVREELEEFGLQYGQIARREAAAALEAEGKRSGALARALRRLFRR